jgi:putative acetyltransferase
MDIPDAQYLIRPERDEDQPAVREVHRRAFGEEVVAALADALRAASAPLSPAGFVAVAVAADADGGGAEGDEDGDGGADGEHVVGHVLLSASRLDAPTRLVDVLVLSPLGVLPGQQRQGIGTRLIRAALEVADERGVPLVFLEGSPTYYAARGFERADSLGFRSPSLRIPPPGFQVARLSSYQSWMTGTLVYSDTFWALDCVGLREQEAAPEPG